VAANDLAILAVLASYGAAERQRIVLRPQALVAEHKEPMIIAIELNEFSVSDLTGHVAASLDTNGPVVLTVQYQRWYSDPWQQVSHVEEASNISR
jgi:hypothetical protein